MNPRYLNCFFIFSCGLGCLALQPLPGLGEATPISPSLALRNTAQALAAKSDYDGAIQTLNQAYALDKATRLQDAATDLNMIGENEIIMDQDDQAVDYFQQALTIRRKVGDRAGEAATLNNLGRTYDELNQNAKEMDCYQQALPIYREVKDRAGELQMLTILGAAYNRLSQYAKAIEYFQQALPILREFKDRDGEADTLHHLGASYRDLSQYDKAIDYFQQALPIMREVKDRGEEADTLDNLGVAYEHLSQYAKAIDCFQLAFPIMREVKDRFGEATTLNNLGATYADLSQYIKAVDFYQQALLIRREVGDRAGEATTLNNLGAAYEHLSQYAKAVDFYQQALPIRRKVGDQAGEAATLNNLGTSYMDLSQYAKAIDYFQQALPILREVKDRFGEANTLSNLGEAYRHLSQYAKAIDLYEPALLIRQEVGDRAGEATTLNNLGAAYVSLSQYAKAVGFYQQALPIHQEVGDRAGEATALNNLGEAYMDLSQYVKAIDFYQQALPIQQEVGDRAGEGATLDNLGAAYDSLRQYAKAIDFFEEALPIHHEVGDRAGEATTLNNLGAAYEHLSQYVKAIDFYQQALHLCHEVGDRAGEATTLDNLGVAYELLSQHAKAIDFFEQALLISREVGDRDGEATTLYNLMFDYQRQRQPRLAIFYGKQAVNVYQSIRQSISALDKESRRTYLESVGHAYRLLAELLIAQGRLPEAQQVLKLLKEQEFFDFLGRSQDHSALPLGTAELTRREQVWAARDSQTAAVLTTLGQQKRAMLRQKTRTPEQQAQLAAVERSLAAAVTAQTQVRQQIDMAFTEAVTTDDAPPAALAAHNVGRALPSGAVAVYTIVAPDKLFLIVTTAHGQVAREAPIKSDDLYRKVLALRNALQDPTHDPRPLAQDLYNIVVGPIGGDLKAAHATALLWSLDDALRYLPISALYDGKRYLVERYQNCVLTLAGTTRPAAAPASAPWTGLGLGVSREHPGFDALPGVRTELAGIIGPVVPGQTLLDGQFTQVTLLAGLKHRHHPLVHIASHFSLSGRDTDSFLLLGDGGHLTMAELKLDPNVFAGVDLLTLSACNTAMEVRSAGGKEVEGFGALAQRLGARSVLASLWPVADASTPVLMREFYRLRRSHPAQNKAEDLRQAQIGLLHGQVTPSVAPSTTNRARRAKIAGAANTNQPLFVTDPKAPYAHPYYWAPFVLIGNAQ